MRHRSELLNLNAIARPKRAAFLIDPSLVSSADLDDITTRCTQYWGGGYWPICPVRDGTLSSGWWGVLQECDPDVVYVLGELTVAARRWLDVAIVPIAVEDLERQGASSQGGQLYLPLTKLDALDNLSILPHYAARQWAGAARPFLFSTRKGPNEASLRFACRTLGFLDDLWRTKAALDGVRYKALRAGEMSVTELLGHLTEGYPRYFSPYDLSCLYSPRPYDVKHDYSHAAVYVVVGDTNAEAVYSWNRKLFSSRHNGVDQVSLSVEQWDDPKTLEALGKWLQFAYWHPQQGQVRVVTSSLSAQDLASGAEAFRRAMRIPVEVRVVDVFEPPFEPTSYGYTLRGDSPGEPPSSTVQQIPGSSTGTLAVVTQPPFQVQHWTYGSWMIDCDLDAALEQPRYSNTVDRWRLPKRRWLSRLFLSRREGRVVKGGLFSTSVRQVDKAFSVRTPSREEVGHALLVESLLAVDREGHVGAKVVIGSREYRTIGLSEQGRRFDGLVELFGGLSSVETHLDDPFLRKLLREAAGKPTDGLAQLTQLIAEYIGAPTQGGAVGDAASSRGNAEGSGGTLAIAEKLARKINREGPRPQTFDLDGLKQRHGKNKRVYPAPAAGDADNERFDDFAVYQLAELVERGVFEQGIEVRCGSCGLLNWYMLGEAKASVACPGCRRTEPLPLLPALRLRLNSLVGQAIARDAMMPVLEAACKLRHRARDMCLTIPAHELITDWGGEAVAEIDLILIVDGVMSLVEVKTRAEGVDEDAVQQLEDLARAILPGRVVVAAKGDRWESDQEILLQGLKERLDLVGVGFEAVLLEW